MALITTDLGWTCYENFYVNESGRIGYHEDDGNGYYIEKANNGSAVCIGIKLANNTYVAALLSTIKANAEIIPSDKVEYVGEFEVENLTWHMYQTAELAESFTTIGSYSFLETGNVSQQRIVEEILIAVGVNSSNKVPTIDYVKEYVEGVLENMPYMTMQELLDSWGD